ncbi:MAG: hypothetical protein K2Q18_13525 [Bdellovibrionales bacterium]|nr:hypothetical protein [Bdellovibrionales bacterium]
MSLKLMVFTVAVLVSSTTVFAKSAQSIIGVAVCAAECNTESLRIKGHDSAIVGTIFYADATEENLNNTNVCLSQAKKVRVYSNRLTDLSLNTCIAALSGKYFGKPVVINPSEKAPEDDGGYFFSIQEIK